MVEKMTIPSYRSPQIRRMLDVCSYFARTPTHMTSIFLPPHYVMCLLHLQPPIGLAPDLCWHGLFLEPKPSEHYLVFQWHIGGCHPLQNSLPMVLVQGSTNYLPAISLRVSVKHLTDLATVRSFHDCL